jgi:hypothetical protein
VNCIELAENERHTDFYVEVPDFRAAWKFSLWLISLVRQAISQTGNHIERWLVSRKLPLYWAIEHFFICLVSYSLGELLTCLLNEFGIY